MSESVDVLAFFGRRIVPERPAAGAPAPREGASVGWKGWFAVSMLVLPLACPFYPK